MKSRLRFTMALTVAAVLGGALLYFSIGGALQTYVSPAELFNESGRARSTASTRSSRQQALPNPQDQAYSPQGLRFWVQDKENAAVRVMVVYTGAVPDAFKATREVVHDRYARAERRSSRSATR